VPVRAVDEAVRRILLLKFRLGLFDHPFVDTAAAARIVGSAAFRQAGEKAQEDAQVLLENRNRTLPLAPSVRQVWLYGVDRRAAAAAGFVVVDRIDRAQAAIVRVQAPFERLHSYIFFGAPQHEGRLDFRADDPGVIAVTQASARVPTVLAVDLDRPSSLTGLRDKASAVLGLFGASDIALMRVISGAAIPKGRLPVEMPAWMAAVRAQNPVRPPDSEGPLYCSARTINSPGTEACVAGQN